MRASCGRWSEQTRFGQVVESMVTALFICYANNPDVMLLNMPELYAEIDLAYNRMVGDGSYEDGGEADEGEAAAAYDEEEEWDEEQDGEWEGEEEEEEWEDEEEWEEEEEAIARKGKKSGV